MAATARNAKAAFEAGLKVANLTKIAAVIEGKAMNGDLQAARMLMDYYGMTTSQANDTEASHSVSGNTVQVNIESERAPRKLRIVGRSTPTDASEDQE